MAHGLIDIEGMDTIIVIPQTTFTNTKRKNHHMHSYCGRLLTPEAQAKLHATHHGRRLNWLPLGCDNTNSRHHNCINTLQLDSFYTRGTGMSACKQTINQMSGTECFLSMPIHTLIVAACVATNHIYTGGQWFWHQTHRSPTCKIPAGNTTTILWQCRPLGGTLFCGISFK